MSLVRRKLTEGEKGSLDFHVDVQLGLEIENPRLIPEYVDRLMKMATGLYLRREGDSLVLDNKCQPVMKLPSFDTINESCDWLGRRNLDYTKSLGIVAANDRFITATINHIAADGLYLCDIIKNIQKKDFIENNNFLSIPQSDEAVFADETAKLDTNFPYIQREKLTLAKSKSQLPPHSLDTFGKHHVFRENAYNLQAYDKADGKFHNLTEYFWTSLTLSMNAFEGKLSQIGCATCINLRPYAKKKDNYHNLISIITPNAPVSPIQTVGELAASIRRDFHGKIKRGDIYADLNPSIVTTFPNSSFAEISVIPPVRIRKPIVDSWMQITVRDMLYRSASSLSQAVINEDTGTNTYSNRLRYLPSQFNDYDAFKLSRSIHYFLTKIPMNMTVQSAFEELVEFQKHIKFQIDVQMQENNE